MKANELMVGDWVIRKGTPQERMKIVSIDNRKGLVHMDFTGLDIAEEIENIEPIPLTCKILETSGFKQSCYEYIYQPTDKEFVHVVYAGTDRYTGMQEFLYAYKRLYANSQLGFAVDVTDRIRYVHELQHLLNFSKLYKEMVL